MENLMILLHQAIMKSNYLLNLSLLEPHSSKRECPTSKREATLNTSFQRTQHHCEKVFCICDDILKALRPRIVKCSAPIFLETQLINRQRIKKYGHKAGVVYR